MSRADESHPGTKARSPMPEGINEGTMTLEQAFDQFFPASEPAPVQSQAEPMAPATEPVTAPAAVVEQPVAEGVPPTVAADTAATQPSEGTHLYAGRFKTVDEVEKGYSEVRAYANRLDDKARKLEAQLFSLQQQLAQPQATDPAAPAAAPTFEPAAAEPELTNESFMEQFATDPVGALRKITEQVAKATEERVRAEIAPVSSYVNDAKNLSAWESAIDAFRPDHPDYDDCVGSMSEYIQKHGLQNASNRAEVLSDAYTYARGKMYNTVAKTPEQLLADPAFIEQVTANPVIRNKVLEASIAATRQQNANLPKHIGGDAGGVSPLMPSVAPKTVEEAHAAFAEAWQRGMS